MPAPPPPTPPLSKAGMSIISRNIRSINAKFDEFSSFVDRENTHNPISAILLQKCWIDDSAIDSLALFNLKDYNMVYQSRQCRWRFANIYTQTI